jgi:hypothetical protein
LSSGPSSLSSDSESESGPGPGPAASAAPPVVAATAATYRVQFRGRVHLHDVTAAVRMQEAAGHRFDIQGKWRTDEGPDHNTAGFLVVQSVSSSAVVEGFANSLGQVKQFQSQKTHNKVRRQVAQKKRRERAKQAKRAAKQAGAA